MAWVVPAVDASSQSVMAVPQSVAAVRSVDVPSAVRNDGQSQSKNNSPSDRQQQQATQDEGRRPVSYQAVLLSSTTLGNLQTVLDRLGRQDERRPAAARTGGDTAGAASDETTQGTEAASGQEDDLPASVVVGPASWSAGNGGEDGSGSSSSNGQSRSSFSGSATGDAGDDWTQRFLPDWSAFGQTFAAVQRAAFSYGQSLEATGMSPYAGKAEQVNVVA